MGTLIDSSVFVAGERGKLDVATWLRGQPKERFAISAITASELLHGVYRAPVGHRRESRRLFVRGILDEYPIYPFDAEVAEVHAELWASLAAQGTNVGAHDLLIAATAIVAGFVVATLNEKEFRRIPRLQVVNPAAG